MGAFETRIRPLSKMNGVPFWPFESVIGRIKTLNEEKAKIDKELVMLRLNLDQRIQDAAKLEDRTLLLSIIYEQFGISA